MLQDIIGPAQWAAIALLIQRGLEEAYSMRNTRRLVAEGAREVGRDFYPIVAVTHLGWIAAIFLLIPAAVQPIWWLLGVYLALQVVRYWVLGTIGRYWTHRVYTVPGAPMVRTGPYRLVRHPNYVVTVVETFLLPAAFGAWQLGAVFAVIWFAVLRYKAAIEDSANAARPERA